MSKKATKTDELVEALCDERVLSKFLDKITSEVNSKLESKFNELIEEMNEKLKISIEKIVEEKTKQSLIPIRNELSSVDERIDVLEANSIKNDLIIVGLLRNSMDKENDGTKIQSHQDMNKELFELVLDHLKNDLEMQISPSDINYVYKLNKNKKEDQTRSSIMVNFNSYAKKYEVIHRARLLRKKANCLPSIFYNERLTKKISELYFKTRTLQRMKKIHSTWIFKGEIYVRKDSISKPSKVTQTKDLTIFE